MLEKQDIIKKVEKAIDLDLFPWQIDYIFYDKDYPSNICPCLIWDNIEPNPMRFYKNRCYMAGRRTGKTLAYCIKLALSEGEPIDIRKPEKYSDRYEIPYSRGFFRRMFIDIWEKLGRAGLPVRKVIM